MSVWPRRSQERCESPSPLQEGLLEPRQRSASDAVVATPRQTAGPGIRLLSGNLSPTEQSPSSTRRLAHLADKLLPNQKNTNLSPIITTHSNMANIAKGHPSPSKASYNSKFLPSRGEMHRLGNLAHLPSGLAPSISQAPSSTSLNLPSSSTPATNTITDPWGALHVHILPLFNGEPLRIAVEDLNVLVKQHISSAISTSPSRALANLEHATSELLASGMATLNAKLTGVDEDKLVGRVVEIWSFFWDNVLTYVEGVLLPLQTDPLLSSLQKTPKRPSSPNRSAQKSSISGTISLPASSYPIDVRTVALRAFRDKVIVPRYTKLYERLAVLNKQETFQDSSYQQPRLQQMLLVLSAQGRRSTALSLTAPTPSTGEAHINDLLRIVRAPRPSDARVPPTLRSPNGQPSPARGFFSGAIPRDRRGRIAQKQKARVTRLGLVGIDNRLGLTLDDDDTSGGETPRNPGIMDLERERERAFLESLRSPGPESAEAIGGWGLGITHDAGGRPNEEEDEPELNWDQAQALVARMVGMEIPESPPPQPPDSGRKRS